MDDDELKKLCDAAIEAYNDQRFDDEASIWERIVSEFPDRYHFVSNLASARANQGRPQEALELLSE